VVKFTLQLPHFPYLRIGGLEDPIHGTGESSYSDQILTFSWKISSSNLEID
jgi:hypothetical protein